MKFSLRDLFWLLAVFALGLGWWINCRGLWLSRRAIDDERIEVIELAEKLHDNLKYAKEEIELRQKMLEARLTWSRIGPVSHHAIDWNVLDERIPPRNWKDAPVKTPLTP